MSIFSRHKTIIIVLILGLFLISLILYLDHHNKITRDQKRISDIKKIQQALDQFYQDNDHYPDSPADGPCDRWDVGFWEKDDSDGFINLLVEKGYLDEPLGDPLFFSRCDRGYFYHRYYCNNSSPVYPCYGCDRPFYVLGIKKLETSKIKSTIQLNSSSSLKCPNRNWSEEFDYVVGEWEEKP